MIGDKVIEKIFVTHQENSIEEIKNFIELEIEKHDILIETHLDIEEEEIGRDKVEDRIN